MLSVKELKKDLRDLAIVQMLAPKPSILPYILGGIGVAIVGGIVATMVLSPRTRQRAVGIAKGGLETVRAQLGSELGGGDHKRGRQQRANFASDSPRS